MHTSGEQCCRRIGCRVPDGAGNYQDSVCVAGGLAAVVYPFGLRHSGRVLEQVLLDPSSWVSYRPSEIPTSTAAAAAAAAALLSQALGIVCMHYFCFHLRCILAVALPSLR